MTATSVRTERDEHVYRHFYRIPRMGVVGLTGHGGPFGFDIGAALAADRLLTAYRCDALVETGCYLGDTTHYLAAAYPGRPLVGCDIVRAHVDFVRHRLRDHQDVEVHHGSSPTVVARVAARHARPFFYLDAHSEESWPLIEELKAIERGVVCIDDFDIGHPRFAYDTWRGVACGPQLLSRVGDRVSEYWILGPEADLPFPCLQTGRRGGKAWLVMGLDTAPMEECPWFLRRRVPERG